MVFNEKRWSCKNDFYRWFLMVVGVDGIILNVKGSI